MSSADFLLSMQHVNRAWVIYSGVKYFKMSSAVIFTQYIDRKSSFYAGRFGSALFRKPYHFFLTLKARSKIIADDNLWFYNYLFFK